MGKKADFHEHISTIWNILIEIMENFSYTEYLHRPDSEEELDFISNSQDLIYIRHVMWRMCIIDLAKLYSKSTNDKYRLEQLFTKLKPEGFFGCLNFSNEKIVQWQNKLTENNQLIVDVNKLRDKIYAHTDTHKNKLKVEISFDKIQLLIEFSKEVVQTIYADIFGAYADIETVYFDKRRINLIKVLVVEKNAKIQSIIDEFNNKEIV